MPRVKRLTLYRLLQLRGWRFHHPNERDRRTYWTRERDGLTLSTAAQVMLFEGWRPQARAHPRTLEKRRRLYAAKQKENQQ